MFSARFSLKPSSQDKQVRLSSEHTEQELTMQGTGRENGESEDRG